MPRTADDWKASLTDDLRPILVPARPPYVMIRDPVAFPNLFLETATGFVQVPWQLYPM